MKPIFESTGAGMADGELVTYTYKLVETMIRVVRLTGDLGGPPGSLGPVGSFTIVLPFVIV